MHVGGKMHVDMKFLHVNMQKLHVNVQKFHVNMHFFPNMHVEEKSHVNMQHLFLMYEKGACDVLCCAPALGMQGRVPLRSRSAHAGMHVHCAGAARTV
jgi:hypothetical protein